MNVDLPVMIDTRLRIDLPSEELKAVGNQMTKNARRGLKEDDCQSLARVDKSRYRLDSQKSG